MKIHVYLKNFLKKRFQKYMRIAGHSSLDQTGNILFIENSQLEEFSLDSKEFDHQVN